MVSDFVTMEPRLTPDQLAAIRQVLDKSHSIDAAQIAVEILDWLADEANIEQYFDPGCDVHRFYLTEGTLDACSETKRLQLLYAVVPDTGSNEEGECLERLHTIVTRAGKAMTADAGRLGRLAEALTARRNAMLARRSRKVAISGAWEVKLGEFAYDTIPQTVSVRTRGSGGQTVVEALIPNGFVVEFELRRPRPSGS